MEKIAMENERKKSFRIRILIIEGPQAKFIIAMIA